jgi:hypothetical protein
LDPSAAMVPVSQTSRHVDCIISHATKPGFSQDANASARVENQVYTCRLCATSATSESQQRVPDHLFPLEYNDIRHTFAFDTYMQSQGRHLLGHHPTCFMPMNWNPLAVGPSLRPAFAPLPIHEQAFRVQDEDPAAVDDNDDNDPQ